MPSTLTWLDYSENDRRLALEVIDLFGDKETRDELGLASVRDVFANLFFPGTSTIQTRAKYFLFVPWIYLELEERKILSIKSADSARKAEISLIEALADSKDRKGIIGIDARSGLKRLPSSIYWSGLQTWGILLFRGPPSQYHRSLDLYYRASKQLKDDDNQPLYGGVQPRWHRGLPEKPDDFPNSATFQLTSGEGRYLRERVITTSPNSLLAFLVENGRSCEQTDFLWQHPQMGEIPQSIKEEIEHARNFSEIINGMSLLYNLMLAEELAEIRGPKALNVEEYRTSLRSWAALVRGRMSAYRHWDMAVFWTIVERNRRINIKTKDFIKDSIDLILKLRRQEDLSNCGPARDMIRRREHFMKGSEARLGNPRALERWRGWSGSAQIDYRWGTVQDIVSDLIKPSKG